MFAKCALGIGLSVSVRAAAMQIAVITKTYNTKLIKAKAVLMEAEAVNQYDWRVSTAQAVRPYRKSLVVCILHLHGVELVVSTGTAGLSAPLVGTSVQACHMFCSAAMLRYDTICQHHPLTSGKLFSAGCPKATGHESRRQNVSGLGSLHWMAMYQS